MKALGSLGSRRNRLEWLEHRVLLSSAAQTPPALGDAITAPAVTSASALPSAPSMLKATAASSTSVDLTWTDNSNNESGFEIERKAGSGFWFQIATVGADITSYHDSGLASNTAYCYRVRAQQQRQFRLFQPGVGYDADRHHSDSSQQPDGDSQFQ